MFRPFWTVKKYNIVAKKPTINTLIRVFFCYWVWTPPGPCFYLRGEGGGGGTIIFSFIRRLAPFWGSKFWISIPLRVFRKMKIFWGMKILWISFGVITKYQKVNPKNGPGLRMFENIRIPPPPFSPRCEYAWNSWTISADVIFCVWGHYTDSKDTLGPRW